MTTIEHNIPVSMLYDDILTLYAMSGTGSTPTHIVDYGGMFGEQYLWATEDIPNDAKYVSLPIFYCIPSSSSSDSAHIHGTTSWKGSRKAQAGRSTVRLHVDSCRDDTRLISSFQRWHYGMFLHLLRTWWAEGCALILGRMASPHLGSCTTRRCSTPKQEG